MTTMMMIGNAHLDPVWLWQWREGYHEVKATFRSALDRLNETPDFVFTCACSCYYKWVEENDPDMFREIRQRVAQGRWAIVGGMWIQPDMNTPCGESQVRQLLYGQRYFADKFGRIATVGYNVDSFGHGAMLPQILKNAGMKDYVWMRPSIVENAGIPEGPMTWEAPEGSSVLAYRIAGEYTTAHNLPEKMDRMLALADRIGKPVMCFYGVGNHGGGPTIENLREIDEYRRQRERGGEVAYASPVDYFDQLRKHDVALPTWRGELQHHASGCYSTHSRSKRLHREAENALLRMEKLTVLSRVLTGHQANAPFVRQAWENLMFNQFHDILGGCSLPEAMEDAERQLSETLSIADREENAALQRISWKVDTIKGLPGRLRSKEEDWKLWGIRGQGTPVVVFNPHPFEATGTVLIRRPVRSVRDDEGASVPSQVIRATRTNGAGDRWDSIFRARVPGLGYRLYWVFLEESPSGQTAVSVSQSHLENPYLRAQFDPRTGALTHLIHKASGLDALQGPASTKVMDIEHCDTWAHNVFKFDQVVGIFGDATIRVEESGPVRAVLGVTTRYGGSELRQRYILYADSDQLEIDVRLDLHERHRMVKMCIPTSCPRSIAEIPYGALERELSGDEEPCQRWVAMQGERGGIALLNDGKYSYSALDGELRLTLANTSIFADHYGQEARDDSCEWMDQGVQRFRCALVPFDGSWQDANLHRRAALLNQPLPHVVETYHEGPLPGLFEGVTIDNPAIDIGAFKRAEAEDGYVLRAVETTGRPQAACLHLVLLDREVQTTWSPFEIKTLFLPDDPKSPICELRSTELPENASG